MPGGRCCDYFCCPHRWQSKARATSCPMKAETFLLRINYRSYCSVNIDQLNVAFDCILMFDLGVFFLFFFLYSSSTTICICGKNPRLTRISATNCRLSSTVQVGSLVKLDWATTWAIPRLVKNYLLFPSFLKEGQSFVSRQCPQTSLHIIVTHLKHRPK